MLEALIGSRVRIKMLTLFLMHPGQEYYLKGLVQELGENNNAIRRELNRLEKIALLQSQWHGRAKFYQVNRQHPLYPELRSIVIKTTGLGQILRDALSELGDIQWAFIYGSVAAGKDDTRSDIDLMVIGDVNLEQLGKLLWNLERQIGREINETIYDANEFARRRDERDAFLERVMQGPKITLVGSANVST